MRRERQVREVDREPAGVVGFGHGVHVERDPIPHVDRDAAAADLLVRDRGALHQRPALRPHVQHAVLCFYAIAANKGQSNATR